MVNDDQSPAPTEDFASYTLGETIDRAVIDSSRGMHSAVARLSAQVRHRVLIVSRTLDNRVFDQADVLSNLRQLTVSQQRAQVRIIVRDIRPAVRRGHRLITLSRRLTSFFEIRTLGRSHQQFNSAFVVADNMGSVFNRFADRYEGQVCFADPKLARDLASQFEAMWTDASVPPDARGLSL